MKTYRAHKCDKNHRTFNTFAKCAWKKPGIPVQVHGEGEYASVSRCADRYELPSYRRTITVHLFPTAEGAEKAKAAIDATACGGNCRRQHEVIRLAKD